MRNAAASASDHVTVPRCSVCATSMEGRRSHARFCSARCKQDAWRHKGSPRPAPRVVALDDEEDEDEDVLDEDTEDDGVPGQQRIPAVEVDPDVWLARGERWALGLGVHGYEVRAESGQARRAPWRMTHQQARAWARMTLSTPAKEAP